MPPQTAANHQEPREFAEFYSAEPPARDPDVPPPAPRLLHTKIIGESYETPFYSPAGQAAFHSANHQTVIINNTYVQPGGSHMVYSGGYGSYYGGPYSGGSVSRGVPYAAPRGGTTGGQTTTPGRSSGGHVAPSTPGVGGSWPSVPNHGPTTNR
jgi:hypothetical protein